jgi:hypothetical protein
MPNNGIKALNTFVPTDQRRQIHVGIGDGIFEDVKVIGVLSGFGGNLLIGELKIEEDVSDGLGHSPEVMIDESKNGRRLFNVHFLQIIKMKSN